MRPLRICVVAACPVPYPRGTPIRVTRLSGAVAQLGHEVHLVTYATSEGTMDPAVRIHRIRDVPGIRVGRPGPSVGKLAVLDPLLALRFRRLLREYSFDVIHAHHYEGLLIASLVRDRKVPLIYDAHTVLETELPTYARWIPTAAVSAVGAALDRRLPSRANFIVAVSEPLRDHLIARRAAPPERVRVIGNGVELRTFPVLQAAPDPPSDGGTIVYAGNLAPYQGIPHLLEGFRTVLERRPLANLRIITTSSFKPFERMARELRVRHRIEIEGATIESLGAALGRAHVAVNPRPKCEGVPQKNLNYMAAGIPLVAFTDSLHPARDGETGRGVRPVSGTALGQVILELLEHPDERMRFAASARAALDPDYTWSGQAGRLVQLYEELSPRAAG